METELSVVNLRTERRFLMMSGAMRTLLRWKGPGIVEYPVPATGRMAPFPTTMEEGTEEDGDRVTIPELEAICEEAPESNTQSEVLEGEMRETVLNALASESGVHGNQAGAGA
jgi:hypothetical protein